VEYRVEALAKAAGVRVDTIRFYQGRGLIPKPRREGRVAIYGDAHLGLLRRIRELLDQGFSLAQIRRVVTDEDAAAAGEPLLQALVEQGVGERTWSLSELASESGLPEALVQAAVAAELMEPLRIDGEERFTQADLEMAESALAILGTGLPLPELLQLAQTHAGNIQAVADAAIDLFGDHIRIPGQGEKAISEVFLQLLPQVTRLVALHFQRTVVKRALERMSGREGFNELELVATQSGRLEVEWR
jgi:DNA-binding transcriptional MerR regulator